MSVSIEKKSDYVNSLKLQNYFEDIARGIENGNTLRESAQLIKECKDKPYFSRNSIETIAKYLRIALCGGTYIDRFDKKHEVEPLMENYHECINGRVKEQEGFKKMRERTGHKDWLSAEEKFVINLYRQGYGPKKIYDKYSMQEDFTIRTLNGVSSFLDSKRKEGLIGKLRINWDGDVGFFALGLLEIYGRDGKFISKNAKSLDDYFFDSKEMVTRSKLSNYYKRVAKEQQQEYQGKEMLAA